MRVLAVNAGSTSLKVSVLDDSDTSRQGLTLEQAADLTPAPDAVAHRVVHGAHRTAAAVIDDELRGQLEQLVELAPLHQPPALAAIDRCRRLWPATPQVACFDTSFHTTIPQARRTYALPARLRAQVQAYGFHGLSHQWSVHRLATLAPAARRVVVAHLGGGESLCGALDGASLATTMGFGPLDGLVMGTRSGQVDPSALLWLAAHTGEDLAQVLEKDSGLQGLCGHSDMRDVLAAAGQGDSDAEFALEVYRERFVSQLAGCVAATEGLDALVFTGGIGEHSAPLRERLAAHLHWLGISLGPARPAGGEQEITGAGSRVRVFVVAAREDLQMRRELLAVLG